MTAKPYTSDSSADVNAENVSLEGSGATKVCTTHTFVSEGKTLTTDDVAEWFLETATDSINRLALLERLYGNQGYAVVKVGDIPEWMEEQYECCCGGAGTWGSDGARDYQYLSDHCCRSAFIPTGVYRIKREPAHRSNGWGES